MTKFYASAGARVGPSYPLTLKYREIRERRALIMGKIIHQIWTQRKVIMGNPALKEELRNFPLKEA